MCLISDGLPPDASVQEVIGSTKAALDRAGIPIEVYEQAVAQPGFQQLLVELHNIYVVIPQTTRVVQAMTKKARTGDGPAIDRFFKHLNATDHDAKDEVRKLEAQGGIEAVLRAVEAQHAKLDQIQRDVSNKNNAEDLEKQALQLITSRDDIFGVAKSIDHSTVFAKSTEKDKPKNRIRKN
jgi:hypothetical protein